MRGSANVSLNEDRLKKLKIPVPSIEKQKELVKDVLRAEQKISEIKRRLNEATKDLEATISALKARF
jgi:restriction endonuclease S subunit